MCTSEVLFVGCRMRALQITNQAGNPPDWAQTAMLASIFATFSQAFCCLVLPLFTGEAGTTDEDGNPQYDMRPLIGAYLISVVRYIALITLHAGVIAVSMAVFIMTPETCMVQNLGKKEEAKELMHFVAYGCLLVVVALTLSSAKLVGTVVKLAIESVDRPLLGVDITVGKAVLGLCRGYINIGNLVVHNPEEQPWTSKYLVKIDRVLIKVNVGRAISSFGKEIEISAIGLEGVDVCFDLPGIGQKSNAQYVLDHIQHLTGEDVPKAEEKEKPKEAPKEKPKETIYIYIYICVCVCIYIYMYMSLSLSLYIYIYIK